MSRLFRMSVVMMLALMGVMGTTATAAAAPGSPADTGTSVAQEETGTVSISNYVCDNVTEETWYGSPDDSCVTAAGTFTFYLVGDGSGEPTTQLAVDESGVGTTEAIPVGDYEVHEEVTGASTTVTVVAGENTLSLLMPSGGGGEPGAPGTVSIAAYDEADAPIEGAVVSIADADGMEVAAGETRSDGVYISPELAPGDYNFSVLAEGYEDNGGFVSVVDGPANAAVTMIAAGGGGDTGVLEISSYLCEGLEAPEWNTDPAADCAPGGAGTFSFYLYGDDSGEPVNTLEVDESGVGSIELPVGSYAVVDEVTGAEVDIDVTAEGPALLSLLRPAAGETPPPADAGTVNLSAFYCDNIDAVEFFSDQPAIMADLPTEEPACEAGAATFSFYLYGDDSGELTDQLVLDASGSGSIELPVGTYDVVEEATGATTQIEVLAGDFTTLTVHIPVGDGTGTGQSVNVSKFYCENVTETEWLTVGAGEENSEALAGAPGCVPGYALFSFYLIGDATDDSAQLEVDGTGSIGLQPGSYEVVEEATQSTFEIEVVEGENTVLVVNNPLPEDGETPPPPPEDGDDGDDDTDGVTKLPSTGHGTGGNDATMLMMAASAASVIAGAGALVVRRHQA